MQRSTKPEEIIQPWKLPGDTHFKAYKSFKEKSKWGKCDGICVEGSKWQGTCTRPTAGLASWPTSIILKEASDPRCRSVGLSCLDLWRGVADNMAKRIFRLRSVAVGHPVGSYAWAQIPWTPEAKTKKADPGFSRRQERYRDNEEKNERASEGSATAIAKKKEGKEKVDKDEREVSSRG